MNAHQGDYFFEVEHAFQRHRQSGTLLSVLDWLLVETWRNAGIPLTAVMRGFESIFERRKNVNSLAYCATEVLRACQEMSEASVGNHGPERRAAGPVVRPRMPLVAWTELRTTMRRDVHLGTIQCRLMRVLSGDTFLIAVPPKGMYVFEALKHKTRISTYAWALGYNIALTVYPDVWQKAQAKVRFDADLEFIDGPVEVGA